MKAVWHWLPIGLGATFLLALGYPQKDRALRGENDFAQLYAGATLAGTPELYSRSANLAVVRSQLGFTMETVVYTRPPFYAALLKPLARLPYRAAYAVFTLATLICAGWFVFRFSRECAALPLVASMSIPILTAVCGGQDTPFLLAILGGSMLLARARREVLAGAVLSLAAIKFHLFLFVPVMLALRGRWRMLEGGAAGLAGLTGLGLAAAGGTEAWQQYRRVLLDPWINPAATIMPNLHGLAAAAGGGTGLEACLIVLVIGASVLIARRSDDDGFALAASLVCGLLASFHSGVPDAIILLPAFVAVERSRPAPPLRAAWALMLTPLPYLMVLADAPYSAAFPVGLLVVTGLSVAAAGRGRAGAGAAGVAERLPAGLT